VTRAALIIAAIMALSASGGGEAGPAYRDGDHVKLSGTVSLVGNEPFARLVLRTDGGYAFFLPAEMDERRRQLLNRSIGVSGTVRVSVLFSADRKHKVTEYRLESVRVIEP
jgi:hypothetical protein